MAKRLALKARLKRLEQRKLRQPLRRRILFDVSDRNSCDICAYASMNGVTVVRLAQEPLADFQVRAFAITSAQFLGALYRTPGAASERSPAAEWHNAALDA